MFLWCSRPTFPVLIHDESPCLAAETSNPAHPHTTLYSPYLPLLTLTMTPTHFRYAGDTGGRRVSSFRSSWASGRLYEDVPDTKGDPWRSEHSEQAHTHFTQVDTKLVKTSS